MSPSFSGFDTHSAYSSGHGTNRASTKANRGVHSPGFTPAALPNPGSAANVAPPQAAPPNQHGYQPSSVQREPAASANSNAFVAPVQSEYAGSSSTGSFYTHPGYVSPPDPYVPQYQAGELSQYEEVFEHGDSESETDEQVPPPPPGAQAFNEGSTRERPQSRPGGRLAPYYDYMFLTGQYPPGTFSHSSSSFEQGNDYWQDDHYIRDYFPAYPRTEQVQTVFEAPQHVQRPSQPAEQNIGSASYGAETGSVQPSGTVGSHGSYIQAGVFEQPSWHKPVGAYGRKKLS